MRPPARVHEGLLMDKLTFPVVGDTLWILDEIDAAAGLPKKNTKPSP